MSRRAMALLAGAAMAAAVLAMSGVAWAAGGRPVIANPRPVPGSTIADTTPVVTATVKDRRTNLRKSNISLYLDGRRIRAFTYGTRTNRLVYRRTTPLAAGTHRVAIFARDKDRNRARKRWSFRVSPARPPQPQPQPPQTSLALPPSTKDPDPVPTVGPLNPDNTTVRSIVRVGGNVWVGGRFTQVMRRDGTVLDAVSNVAVFDAATGQYKDVAPMLGDANSRVYDMAVYGTNVVIAGEFAGPSATEENLVVVDGTSGRVIRWYDARALRSVLAAPQLGRIYGGGVNLSAFDFATGERLWMKAKTSLDPNITRANNAAAGYRDLELDPDGRTIWAACGCDSIDDQPAKALVKLDTEGNHDASWATRATPAAVGVSLAQLNNTLYLGAGGDDFLAAYPKTGNGARSWFRDTSGGVQAVETMGGGLVIGGHFTEVADQETDVCGNEDLGGVGPDPRNVCQTRLGAAAYTLGGTLDRWAPKITGGEEVWALRPDGTRLHVGGDFRQVNDVPGSHHYARLSP